ncbi:hypothetical protein [uncultured Alteromonas sp.]|jgi:hypothetical protein|uniref:hypothetical protein n=1 Tax=uncultured Alteromonas sp. TaxID=179113 RepID=UPI0025D25D56|nr:hypothetical protein [uncultured Alteromonas sp.]
MKKLLLTLASLVAFSSQAAVISVDLAESEIAVGETTTVNITGAFDSQTEAFDFALLSVFFDNSSLLVDSLSLGSDLPSDDVFFDPYVEFSENVGDVTMGWYSLFAGAYTNPAPFSLFSFDVTATAEGVFDFTFDTTDMLSFDFFDSATFAPIAFEISEASLTVTDGVAADVSAPQTALLLSLAMGGLLVARRRS